MFEVFGKSKNSDDIAKLKKRHKTNGLLYFFIFIIVSYLCISFIAGTKADLSPRATFHAVFALTVLVLLCLKVTFVRFYRQFYNQVKTIGLLIALISFGMVGTSGGYYLLITKFGTDKAVEKAIDKRAEMPQKKDEIVVKTDPESVKRGKELYDSKCFSCHDPYSEDTIIGPGHKGILKNPLLPVSKRKANPQNIYLQLREPFSQMPSFAYLSEEEAEDIIAFLNTL
jgi:hypothetical protein